VEAPLTPKPRSVARCPQGDDRACAATVMRLPSCVCCDRLLASRAQARRFHRCGVPLHAAHAVRRLAKRRTGRFLMGFRPL